MWIIPSNHRLYSAFAQECVASKEELSVLSGKLEQRLFWKSKPLSLKTWCNKWNKVYWLPHLFSRTLKVSIPDHLLEGLMELREDFLANPSQLPENNLEKKTQDICGHISEKEKTQSWEQLDLYGHSSKMSQVCSNSDIGKSNRTWNRLVTKLKREYSLRKKLVRLTRERDCSSLQSEGIGLQHWTTPTGSDGMMSKKDLSKLILTKNGTWRYVAENGVTSNAGLSNQVHPELNWPTATINGNHNRKGASKKSGNGLSTEVNNWATPRAFMFKDAKEDRGKSNLGEQVMGKMNWATPNTMNPKTEKALLKEVTETRPGRTMLSNLRDQVNSWPTPASSMYKGSSEGAQTRKNGQNRENDRLDHKVFVTDGQRVQGNHSSNGKNPVLNPAWVFQLMGTTIEKTFFAWREMPLFRNRQNSHG